MTTLTGHMQVVVTVLLPNHSDQDHTYDFLPGTTYEQAREARQSLHQKIAATTVSHIPLVLGNPTITYPAAHILGVKVSVITEEELINAEEELRAATEAQQRRAGLVKS